MESQIDLLCAKLGMDPLEFRRRNALEKGSTTHLGQVLKDSVGIKKALLALQEPYSLARRWAKSARGSSLKRGVGLACSWGFYGPPVGAETKASVELRRDGRVLITTGVVEIGQGSTTTFAQIASQELGLPLENLDFIMGDTALSPYQASSGGQKATLQSGYAVQQAAVKLREVLVKVAKGVLEGERDIGLKDGWAYSLSSDRRVSLAELASFLEQRGLPLRYEGSFSGWMLTSPRLDRLEGGLGNIYGYLVTMAEVEVDLERGKVRVVRIHHAQDVGRVVNPMNWESQVEGGVMMGIGLALKEKFIVGKTATLKAYSIPTFLDVPEIVVLPVEEASSLGPYGAKGGGEMCSNGTAPAIANAVADAVGVRFYELPIVAEKLRKALNGFRP